MRPSGRNTFLTADELLMHYLTVARTFIYVCVLQSLAYPVNAQGRGAGTEIDRGVDEVVDRQVEQQVARSIERQVERQVGRRVERQVDRRVDAQVQKQVDRSTRVFSSMRVGPNSGEGNKPNTVPATKPASAKSLPSTPDGKDQDASPYSPSRYFELDTDETGEHFLTNQRLLLIDARTLAILDERDIAYRKSTALKTFDKVLLELDEADVAALGQLSDSITIDLPPDEPDHLYRYQSGPSSSNRTTGWLPKDALPFDVSVDVVKNLKIGLIDSLVDRRHVSLRKAEITSVSFVAPGLQEPSIHGTAVMSILAGNSRGYQGLVPEARFYSASVFYSIPNYGDSATTKSILFALDWLAQMGVDVINMSIAGPPNPLLEQAVVALSSKGIRIVAAAGNAGPGAAPAYPAAYPDVIAVTAISRKNIAYYRANHGAYIDFAAPGVDVTTAAGVNQFSPSTGTSYAAPFVTALLATLGRDVAEVNTRRLLQNQALDLGDPGFDKTYGHGRVRMPLR